MIELDGVTKIYGNGEVKVRALGPVDLLIEEGDFVAIMGPSGSGKSTMMNILGCLDVPSTGRYTLDGIDVSKLRDNKLAAIRNTRIGFVFQSFNLIPVLTARENITLPLTLAGSKPEDGWFDTLVGAVGLGDRLTHRPAELSGGQQQRVAVARALVTNPAIILADEPTGNLDSTSTVEIMRLLVELNDAGRTVILITHEPEVAEFAKRVVELRDGTIVRDVRQKRLIAS